MFDSSEKGKQDCGLYVQPQREQGGTAYSDAI